MTKDAVAMFPRSQRRILISNLQPCTQYSFRVVSNVETGDLGDSEAKCFTESVEIIHENPNAVSIPHNDGTLKDVESDSGLKVLELGKILHLAWAQEHGYLDDISGAALLGVGKVIKPETSKSDKSLSPSNRLDLNVTVRELNDELAPPVDFSGDDDNRSCESENGAHHRPIEVDLGAEVSRKRSASTLISGSPYGTQKDEPGSLDGNYEYCLEIIRWLECQGYIKREFRLKLPTWFSLSSTEQERTVVNTYIHTLIDDPTSLAGQLVHSFADIVNTKRPRNEFCS